MCSSLPENLNTFLAAARKRPEIAQLTHHIPAQRAAAIHQRGPRQGLKQGVAISDVYRTIQAFMGGLFINYFNRFGRQWQVYVEAEGEYRGRAGERRAILRPQQQWTDGSALCADNVQAALRA